MQALWLSHILSTLVLPRNLSKAQKTEIVHTTPYDNENGTFTFPREWPSTFFIGSQINITWETQFQYADLYYYQNGKATESVNVAKFLAQRWYLWDVNTSETNLTEPFVFRIVNAQGMAYEKTRLGFFSSGFYITRDTDLVEHPSAGRESTEPEPTHPPTAAEKSTNAPKNPNSNGSLSTGARVGTAVGVILAFILLASAGAAVFLYAHRGSGKQATEAPPETRSGPVSPEIPIEQVEEGYFPGGRIYPAGNGAVRATPRHIPLEVAVGRTYQPQVEDGQTAKV